ncbi:MAG: sugar phosphate nucleotidyltransferase [Candidatus Omnitrophota bacterium]|jgi:NDP-sugar pyrophosphorylase family protein
MLPEAVILSGGPATRLRPITHKVPKGMVGVAGEPFIAHQLRLLKSKGISRVLILAGYLGGQIKDFVKDGSAFGIEAHYSFDGEKLLGTGGAVKKAFGMMGDPFFLMYGDSYLDTEYKQIYEYFLKQGKPALMAVFKNNDRWDKSNIEYKDGMITGYDKVNPAGRMEYIDYGLSLIRKEAFAGREYPQVFGIDRLYQDLISEGKLAAYEVKERFFEIGSLKGLEEADKYLRGISRAKEEGERDG